MDLDFARDQLGDGLSNRLNDENSDDIKHAGGTFLQNP